MITTQSPPRRNNRISLRLTLACIALAMISGCSGKGEATVKITNRSSDIILNGSVAVCGATGRIDRLQPNASQTVILVVRCDSAYDLSVSFENGAILHESVGYVTRGLRYWDDIEVTNSRVSLSRVEVKSF